MMAQHGHDNALSGSGFSFRICLAALLLFLILPASTLFAQDDPIYEKCVSQSDDPAPWCYQQEVERIGDPDLCENILKYWPKADGVHGQCYYELAIHNKDCELCKRIKNEQIRKMCELDACK